MEGDFSRGHRPDARRGQAYRRVLARQGAALLDSDLNALMDASDRIDRQGLRHVACAAGSTDLGFFVTPGRLLALFDPVLGATPVAAGDQRGSWPAVSEPDAARGARVVVLISWLPSRRHGGRRSTGRPC